MIDRILAHDFYSGNYIMLMGKRDFANVIKVTNQLTLKWILRGSDVITWALKQSIFLAAEDIRDEKGTCKVMSSEAEGKCTRIRERLQ